MKKYIFLFFVFFLSIPIFGAELIRDTEIEEGILELINPLIKQAKINNKHININIINKDEFNAFVKQGEDIYIYSGLIKQLKSASAFQAVIAHELGHIIGGHHSQLSSRLEAELKRDILMKVLGAGLIIADPSLGMGIVLGSSSITNRSLLSFARDEERLADNIGLNLMIKSNLNPYGFIEVFTEMQNYQGILESKIDPNKINHPLTSERLKNIKEQLKNKKQKFRKQDNSNYNLLRAKLIAHTEKDISFFYNKNNKDNPSLYAWAIFYMKNGEYKESEKYIKKLIKKGGTYFYELAGDFYYKKGDFNKSIFYYEKSLEKTNSAQIKIALSLSLLGRNKNQDKEKAYTLCKESIIKDKYPFAYIVLAKLESGYKSDYAMIMYYFETKQKEKAKQIINKKIDLFPKKTPEYIKILDIKNSLQ